MSSPNHIRGLDGLRGLAAYSVLVGHTLILGTDIGGLSVFLFFILSGYLITGLLARGRVKIEAGQAEFGPELANFWIGRALRIFPAYYVWLGVMLILDHVYYQDQTISHLGWYILYAQNFLIAFKTQVWQDFTHTWSLAVEQQFYMFFAPLVLIVPARWHRRLFVAVITGSLALIAWLGYAGYGMITIYPLPSTGFVFMAVGGWIAITPRERLSVFARPGLVLPCLVILIVLGCYPILERNEIVHVPYVLLDSVSASVLGVIMMAVLGAPESWAVSLLETNVPRFLGKISYALYIIHLPVSLWMWDFGGMETAAAVLHIPPRVICIVAVTAVSVPLAVLSYWLIEKPCLDLKRTWKVRSKSLA